MRDDTVAIVPAGGESRRLGELVGPGGKAAVVLDGESLLGRVCRQLTGEVGRVIVVTAAGRVLPPLPPEVEVVFDCEPGGGPLAAIRDGLAHAVASPGPPPQVAVLVACDLPMLDPTLVRRLIDGVGQASCRWMVPVVGGHPQLLLSAISLECRPLVEQLAATDRPSLRQLLTRLTATEPEAVRLVTEEDLARWGISLDSCGDIDTPAELESRRRR